MFNYNDIYMSPEAYMTIKNWDLAIDQSYIDRYDKYPSITQLNVTNTITSRFEVWEGLGIPKEIEFEQARLELDLEKELKQTKIPELKVDKYKLRLCRIELVDE